MPHVKIQIRPDDRGTLEVDGVDLTKYLLRDGLSVDFTTSPPTVGVRLVPGMLDIDLPEALLSAVRVEVEGTFAGPWGAAVKAVRDEVTE